MQKKLLIDLETYDPGYQNKQVPVGQLDNGYIAGIAIAVEGWKGYFPIRHEGGGNFDESYS